MYVQLAMAAFSALSSSSKVKVSKAQADTESGLGVFGAKNKQSYAKPMIDFSEPLQVAALGAVVVIGLYAFKKIRKG